MATKGKTGQVTALNNKWPALKQPLANAAVKEGKLTKDSTNKDLYDSLSKVIKAAVADLYNTTLTDPRLVSIVRTIIAYVNGAVKQLIEDNSAIQDIVDNTSKDAISTIVEKAVEVAIKLNATSKDLTNKLADAIAKSVVKAISASKDKEKHDKLLADIKSMLEQLTSNTTTSSNKIETKTSTAKTSTVNLKSINDVLKKLMKICNNMQKLLTNISNNTNFIVKKLDATHIISTKMKKQVELTTKIQQQIQTTTDEGFKNTNDNIEKVNNAVEEANENIKNIQSGSMLSGVLGGSVGLAFKALGFIGKLVLAPAKFLFKWILKPIFGFVGRAIGGLLKGIGSLIAAPFKLLIKGIGKVVDIVTNTATKTLGTFFMTPAGMYTLGFIGGFIWEMWLKDIWDKIKKVVDRVKIFFDDIDSGKGFSVAFKRLFFGEGSENTSWSELIKTAIFGEGSENESLSDLITNAIKTTLFGEDAKNKSWSDIIADGILSFYESNAFRNTTLFAIIDGIYDALIQVSRYTNKELFEKLSDARNIALNKKLKEEQDNTTLEQRVAKAIAAAVNVLLTEVKDVAKAINTAKIVESALKNELVYEQAEQKALENLTATKNIPTAIGPGALPGLDFFGLWLRNTFKSLISKSSDYLLHDLRNAKREAKREALEKLGLTVEQYEENEDRINEAYKISDPLLQYRVLNDILGSIAAELNAKLAGIPDENSPEYLAWHEIQTKKAENAVDKAVSAIEAISTNLTEKAALLKNDNNKIEIEEANRRNAASSISNSNLSISRTAPKITYDDYDFNNLANAAIEAGIPSVIVDTKNSETLAKNIANYLSDAQQLINAMPADEQRTWQSRLMDIVMKINEAVNKRSTQQNNYLFMELPNLSLWNADRTQ